MTLIVLLILAGVSLSIIFSQDGIFSKAELAAIKHENEAVYESLTLQAQDYKMRDYEAGTKTKLFDRFKGDSYISDTGIVNMAKVSNGSSKTGKGDLTKGDVYVIKQIEEDGDYYLFYYDEKNQGNNIGKLFDNTVIEQAKTLVSMFKKAQEENCLDGKTCSNFEEHVHVGDYVVNYNSTLKNSSAIANLLAEETGTDVTQTYKVDTSTTWRVAGLNKDGTQLIITSGSPIKKQMDTTSDNYILKDPYLYLKGAEGWYHTNDELTNDNILDRASKIYDSKYASKISSMRIEDIEILLGLSIEPNGENTKAYKTVNGTKTELGEETNQHLFGQSYTYKNGDYAPENYLKEKYSSNSKYASLQTKEAGNSVPSSAYMYRIADSSVVDPSSKIFDVLFKDTTDSPWSKRYWLASSDINAYKDFHCGSGAVIAGGAYSGGSLFYSSRPCGKKSSCGASCSLSTS